MKTLRIKKRTSFFFIFLCSIFFVSYVSSLGVLKSWMGEEYHGGIPGLKEGAHTLTEFFVPIKYKASLLTENFKGITFYYPKEEEKSMKSMNTMSRIENNHIETKETLDKIYGENPTTNLTVVIYDNEKKFAQANAANLSGTYNPHTHTIELKSVKLIGPYNVDSLFLHEYTHYRTHQFMEQNHISETKIPSWFHEGVASFVEDKDEDKYVKESLKKIIDFTKINSSKQFQEARDKGYTPYPQSCLAIRELVHQYGIDVIPKLIIAAKDKSFYTAFHDITGMSIEEFQINLFGKAE